MKHTERLQGYFKSHPAADKFFVTHDGTAFFIKENAEAYAQVFKSPEEKSVTEVTRAEVMTDGNSKTEIPNTKETPAKKATAKK